MAGACLPVCLPGWLLVGWARVNTLETSWIILINWLNAVAAIHQLVALGRQKLQLFNGLNVIQSLLTLGAIAFIFTYIKKEPVAYLWALFAAWTLTGLIGFLAVYFIPDHHAFSSWKKLTKEGFRTGIANQTDTFMQLINTRIAYLLLPVSGTGIYSNAVSLCEACLLINASIGTVQYPRIARMGSDKNQPPAQVRKQQIDLTRQCFWANALLMLVALTVLALLPASLYAWLFGPAV